MAKPVTDAERDQIAALYRDVAADLRIRDIAERTGRPFGTVANVIAKLIRSGELVGRGYNPRRAPVPVPRDAVA